MLSSSSSCSEIDITIALMAMISLTMSRRLGVELGELRQVDRLDQGAEDRALGLVIGLEMARVGRRRSERRRRRLRNPGARLPRAGAGTSWAPRPAEGIGARPPSITPDGPDGGAVCGAGCGAGGNDVLAAGWACGRGAAPGTRVSAVLRFPNTQLTSDRPSGPLEQLFEERQLAGLRFLRVGAAGEHLRKLAEGLGSAVAGREFGDHLPIVGGGAEHLRLERDDGNWPLIERLREISGIDLGSLGHSDLVEAIVRAAVVGPRRLQ